MTAEGIPFNRTRIMDQLGHNPYFLYPNRFHYTTSDVVHLEKGKRYLVEAQQSELRGKTVQVDIRLTLG